MNRGWWIVTRNGNPLDSAVNSPPAARAQLRFKAAVFALLVLNSGTYLLTGTFSEGLDSIAWLTLLALFELETGSGRTRFLVGKLGRTPFLETRKWDEKRCASQFSAIATVHGIRLATLAAVGLAAAGFLYNNEWLDSANSVLWIILYAGLGALALVWLWQGEWFAAYDAALWLVAFATIEMNLLTEA